MLFCRRKHWAGSVLFAVSLVHAPAFTLGRTRPHLGDRGFTYKVKASIASDDLGFDRLAIDTPARVQRVDAVRLSGQPVAFDIVHSDDTGVVLAVPVMDAQRTEEVLEVDFHASVFQFGTVFTGRIFNSQRPCGGAAGVGVGGCGWVPSSERLRVDLTGLGTGPLGALSVEPGVIQSQWGWDQRCGRDWLRCAEFVRVVVGGMLGI